MYVANLQQGGHKVGEKNSLSFPGFSRAINLLFHRLSQQKVNVIITFIKVHINSSNITGHHSTLISSLMILFTQSTAVLHKYLKDELKYFLLQFFTEKSLSIPGLWPPWSNHSTDDRSRLVSLLLAVNIPYFAKNLPNPDILPKILPKPDLANLPKMAKSTKLPVLFIGPG